MKRRVALTLALSTIASSAAVANDPSGLGLFVPDLTEAHFAASLDAGPEAVNGLPLTQGFWTDLVNSADVPQDGNGVYVAVLDTGLMADWPFFFSHAKIADEYGKGFSHDVYCDGDDLVIGDLRDDRGFDNGLASGHGTHVASTVVGYNFNDAEWVEGVAPEATIIPVLVLDAWVVVGPCVGGVAGLSGGTDEMISAGIRYVADLKDSELGGAPVVINMSLGGPTRSEMIEDAVDYAIEKGVIVVASGGNNGSDGMGYPGGLEQIISAGAAGWSSMFVYGWRADVPEKLNTPDILGNDWQTYLANFSSRPNKDLDQKHQDLDVTAPGSFVVGPYQCTFAAYGNCGPGYYFLSGTSMSAPHVTGMSALVLQEYPEISQHEMEFILSNGASGVPLPASDAIYYYPFAAPFERLASWDGGDYGAGFLTADKALRSAKKFVK